MNGFLQYRSLSRHVQNQFAGGKGIPQPARSESTNVGSLEFVGKVSQQPLERLRSEQDLAAAKSAQIVPEPTPCQNTAVNDDQILVAFEDGDRFNPKTWSRTRRIATTLLVLTAGLAGAWGSANDSYIIIKAADTFHVSSVVESLSTGVYLIAYGIGSLVTAPFSETLGRLPVYLATLLLFMISEMASALAPTLGAQLVFRFLAGLSGCTAVTTFAGSVSDLWEPVDRMTVFGLSSAVTFCLVFTSPVVSGFIGDSSISWRWTEWIAMLVSTVAFLLIALFSPETYAPVILSWKAACHRKVTRDQRYRAPIELDAITLKTRLAHSLYRPFQMLQHVSVVFFSVYLTVLYIVTFTFLTGYQYIYADVYGFTQRSVGLCFLGLVIGNLLGVVIAIPIQWRYTKAFRGANQNGRTSLDPGEKLWLGIITAPCLPIGLFWMAWTSYASVSYWSTLGGSVLVGITFLGVFVSSYLYLIDTFENFAASALAFTTFARYIAAGGMIPASIPMYENLGLHWTLTLLACISLILTPVPYGFYMWGR